MSAAFSSTASRSQSSKSWNPCTAAYATATGFLGIGRSPSEVRDLETVTSSSKSFCEYDPVKLLPEEEIFPKEAVFGFFVLEAFKAVWSAWF